MFRHLNLFNALLILPLAYWLLRSGDYNHQVRTSVELGMKHGGMFGMRDLMLGLFVVTPLATAITAALFWWFKEQRTLANVATVFAAAFGFLSCLYFLWTIRPIG